MMRGVIFWVDNLFYFLLKVLKLTDENFGNDGGDVGDGCDGADDIYHIM